MKRLIGFVLALCWTASAHAGLVLDVGSGGEAIECGGCGDFLGSTFGWEFDVTSGFSIDGLGVWDAGADGIGRRTNVGLWDSGGTLLASALITNASSPEASSGAGVWLFEDILDLYLAPGRYTVGNVIFSETPLAQFGTAFTTIPEVTYIVGKRAGAGADTGFLLPDQDFTPLGVDGIFGPTLRVANQVPAPGSLALLCTALAAALYRLRARN